MVLHRTAQSIQAEVFATANNSYSVPNVNIKVIEGALSNNNTTIETLK